MARFWDMILVAILVAFFTEGALSNVLVKEIDLFKEVGLLDKALPLGVTSTKAQHSKSSAFHFATSAQDLIANQNAYDQTNKLIHESHDLWVSAWTKIDPGRFSDNTIVSISSKDGNDLYFKLMIAGDSRGAGLDIEVSVKHKKGADPSIYTASSDRYLVFTDWHKVAVRLQDSEKLIRIYIDDMVTPVKVDLLDGIAVFPSDAQLRLAQVFEVIRENSGSINNRFKGSLQDVKFIRGSGSNLNCPPLGTCKCSDSVGKKSCVVDGLRYEDGRRWNKPDNCTICQCKWGQVICTYTCEVCKDGHQTYLDGETWKSANNSCYTCNCQKGKSVCSPPPCPKPDCTGKSGKLAIPKGQCCEICAEDLQCLGTGKVYKKCGCDKTCDNFQDPSCSGQCTEGCFCSDGKVMNEHGKCRANARCPCTHDGKKVKSGQSFFKGCQFFYCVSGKMITFSLC